MTNATRQPTRNNFGAGFGYNCGVCGEAMPYARHAAAYNEAGNRPLIMLRCLRGHEWTRAPGEDWVLA